MKGPTPGPPVSPPGTSATATTDTPQVIGAVLCGGRSKRMGQDKALLPHPNGETFLSHAVTRLLKLCPHVLILGPHDSSSLPQITRHRVTPLPDEHPHQGPLGGVVTALHWLAHTNSLPCPVTPHPVTPHTGLLVTPVDMPALRDKEIRPLIQHYRQTPQPSLPPICCATIDGDRPEPLVAIYPLHVAPLLQQRLQSTDRSLSRWLRQTPHQLCPLPARYGKNVNTPDDFESLSS